MKAIGFKKFGSAEVLEEIDMDIPSPKDKQVLVKVQATTIDNVDIIIRKGLYKTKLNNPAITGRDLVGYVVDFGKDVQEFSKGDPVWTNSAGFDGRMGASAEYVVVDANRLYKIPKGVDPNKVLASVHSSSTANLVCKNIMKLNENSTILIEGAGGNVGRKLVQCAHDMGAKVLTSSAEKDFDYLKKLGANQVFSYKEEKIEELRQVSKEIPINHIIDTSGKIDLAHSIEFLGLNGQVTIITAPKSTNFNPLDFYTKGKKIVGFVLSRARVDDLKTNANDLNQYFKKGLLLEDKIEYHTFKDIPKLHSLMEAKGAHEVKFIIIP